MSTQLTSAPGAGRHAVFHELRVSAIEPLTDDSVAISFAVPAELREAYAFVQGQHLSLRCTVAGDDVRRTYSISTPAGSGTLRIGVKRLPGGVFSGYAHSRLRVGDPIEVMTPTGGFHVPLDPAASRRYAAVAAGSGITPILSIIATTLEVEPRSDVVLILGNRTAQSVMFLEDLADLKNRYLPRLAIHHVLSREPQESDLLSGRIDAEKMRRFLDLLLPAGPVHEWFLCGPEPMIDGCRAVLIESGIAPGRIHSELFHVEGSAARPEVTAQPVPSGAPDAAVTVILDGRGSMFTMARDGEVILDAALRVRGDAPYSCKSGVCGTCRAKLVQGRVRMDRCHALEPPEVDAGFVLACQSRPVSDSVTLDFDA
ncbi:MAG TPA: 1,2-phenylacetyl-CoA epoxidase subunit PaaE [Candidatus Binatia bacterium]|nr:1,2-phenylacetyl-CoA epoxidase subunit PaaE [Candidatus Binatia bacterium]